MNTQSQQRIIENYRHLLSVHGPTPEAAQMSAEGQAFRFAKLMEIGDLRERSVLDLGCGIGEFYPFLKARVPDAGYTGLDIVPEMIACARSRFRDGAFLCRDILDQGLDGEFDYVFISAMFNNNLPGMTVFLEEMITTAFAKCRLGLAFNFLSDRVNFRGPAMAYHDPARVLTFCMDQLSPRVRMEHHYERCDVSVFVYR